VKIATWNVNSVRQRTEHLLRYLRDAKPDVLCLQELKCMDAAFPFMEVEAEGYNAAVHGQKGFNGVAILAKAPIEVVRDYRGPDDEQARYIEAIVQTAIASSAWPRSICQMAIRRKPRNLVTN